MAGPRNSIISDTSANGSYRPLTKYRPMIFQEGDRRACNV